VVGSKWSRRDGITDIERAGELKLWAERKLGAMLAETVKRGGDRKSKSHDATLKTLPNGITQSDSSRWRKVAGVPEREFREHLRSHEKGPVAA
jgi:hypothetical protein